jgi:GTPase SAR1 family protein
VGKTNLVYRFVKSGTDQTKNIAPTVGVEFSSKMVRLQDGRRIKAQIWDTGNTYSTQPDRNSIAPSPPRTSLTKKTLQKGLGCVGGVRHHQIREF